MEKHPNVPKKDKVAISLVILLVAICLLLGMFSKTLKVNASDVAQTSTPTEQYHYWIEDPAYQGGQAFCYKELGLDWPTCISIVEFQRLYGVPTPTPLPAYPGIETYPEPIVAYPGPEINASYGGGTYAVPDEKRSFVEKIESIVEKVETWIVSLGNKRDKGK